jgi:hypothetical protein
MYNNGYSCQIVIKLEFSRQSFEKSSNNTFYQNRPVAAELFHADRQADGRTEGRMDSRTDMTKLKVAFSYFANAFKNEKRFCVS